MSKAGTRERRNPGIKNNFHYLLVLALCLIVVWLALFNLNFRSDGERYFSFLRSLFFDHDLNFYNEYTFYTFLPAPEKSNFLVKTETGYLWNPFSIGPAVLWLPFFLLGHCAALVVSWLGYPILVNGYSLPYLMMSACGTLFYTLVGQIACFFLLRRSFSARISFWAVFIVFWSSPLPAYVLREPAYSHSMSFCFISLLLLMWSRFRDTWGMKINIWDMLLLSVLGGLASLVRWQNCFILVFPVVDMFFIWYRSVTPHERKNRFVALLSIILLMVFCFFVFVAPQFIAWKVLFGTFFTVPQGDHFMHWTDPALVKVLFSPLNGLFVWHPLLLFALVGLVLFWSRAPHLVLAGFFFFMIQAWINGAVDDWFAGAAFGNRRFINCLPLMMIGGAALLSLPGKRFARFLTAGVMIFPLWNYILMVRSYNGDLAGLKGLRFDNLFFNAALWPHDAWSFLSANYLYYTYFLPGGWAGGGVRFLFAFLLVVFIAVMAGLIVFWMARLFDSPGESQPGGTFRVVLGLTMAIALISVILAYTGMNAVTVYPVHLGPDAFGKTDGLKVLHPNRFMGSMTPIHLEPGQETSISLDPHGVWSSVRFISTLSGESDPPKGSFPVLHGVFSAFGENAAEITLTYPLQVMRMDTDEFDVHFSHRPDIVSSWFVPGPKQTVPHHWYGATVDFGKPLYTDSIVLKNLSHDMELHITGIAFLE